MTHRWLLVSTPRAPGIPGENWVLSANQVLAESNNALVEKDQEVWTQETEHMVRSDVAEDGWRGQISSLGGGDTVKHNKQKTLARF